MTKYTEPSRRRFLKRLGRGALAAGIALEGNRLSMAGKDSQVRKRPLGNTGLMVSEVGFGGHSWAYKRVPDGQGGLRTPTIEEAVEMIRAGMEMGVNLFDSCTRLAESSIPGEALKRLGARQEAIIAVRVSHKMKGEKADREEIYEWTEKRLELWQTDHIDLLLLCNTEQDTPQSGYWDMSYSLEALDRLKEQGKIRFTGFGCHFTPELFLEAFEKFGDYFDICSMPYNVRHRAAERLFPAAKQAGLGVITIKPFARGSLLKKRDLEGEDAGLARNMISFVLENPNLDCCLCGVHTVEHVRENFSASWNPLDGEARERLRIASRTNCRDHAWLEQDWLHA